MKKPYSKEQWPGLLLLAAALGVAGLFVASLTSEEGFLGVLRFGMVLNLMFFVLIGAFYLHRFERDRVGERLIRWTLAVATVVGLLSLGKVVYDHYQAPYEWDFLCWYMDGSVAASGLDFYQPESYYAVAAQADLPIEPGPTFVRHIYDVGFRYPPQTMLLFYPLGFFDFYTAQVIWSIVTLFFLGAVLFKIKQLFFRDYDNTLAWLFCIPFLLCFPKVKTVLTFQQTTLVLLFLLLLMYQYVHEKRSGIFLALAAVVKPIGVIWGLFFLAGRKWGAILYGALAVAGITLAAYAVFGAPAFESFIYDNPTPRQPLTKWTGAYNQSIIATLVRYTNFDLTAGSPLSSPLTLLPVALLTGVAAYFIYRAPRAHLHWSIGLTVALSLLIYPQVFAQYSVFLLPTILLFLREEKLPVKGPFLYAIVFLFALAVQFAVTSMYGVLLIFGALVYLQSQLSRDVRDTDARTAFS